MAGKVARFSMPLPGVGGMGRSHRHQPPEVKSACVHNFRNTDIYVNLPRTERARKKKKPGATWGEHLDPNPNMPIKAKTPSSTPLIMPLLLPHASRRSQRCGCISNALKLRLKRETDTGQHVPFPFSFREKDIPTGLLLATGAFISLEEGCVPFFFLLS